MPRPSSLKIAWCAPFYQTNVAPSVPTMAVNAEVPAGTGQGQFTGATIQFNNKATNQDGCKGATVNLAYAIA